MMMRKALLVGGLAVLTAGCSTDEPGGSSDALNSTPTAPSGTAPATGNVEVTGVRVFVKDGQPQAFVQGNLGDGCTSLESVTQERSGQRIAIALTSVHRGEVCTMIMQMVNEWVPLQGVVTPGEYTVRANKAALDFRLVQGPDGLRVEPDPGPLPPGPNGRR